MLKLKVKTMDTKQQQKPNPSPQSEIESSQKPVEKPIFSEDEILAKKEDSSETTLVEMRRLSNVKFNLNAIQEGLSLAKKNRRLPPYMKVDFTFTPRMLEHHSKEMIKDNVKEINYNI